MVGKLDNAVLFHSIQIKDDFALPVEAWASTQYPHCPLCVSNAQHLMPIYPIRVLRDANVFLAVLCRVPGSAAAALRPRVLCPSRDLCDFLVTQNPYQ